MVRYCSSTKLAPSMDKDDGMCKMRGAGKVRNSIKCGEFGAGQKCRVTHKVRHDVSYRCVSGLLYCRVYSLLKHHSAFTVAVDAGVTSMEM